LHQLFNAIRENNFNVKIVFVLSVRNTLKMSDVNEKDNCGYTCEVETKDRNNPKSITHKLLLLQRPKIFTTSSQHNLTVIKGSSVVLNCSASGKSELLLVWTKRGRDLAGLDHRLRNAIQIKLKLLLYS
jgi:hypothetical protein